MSQPAGSTPTGAENAPARVNRAPRYHVGKIKGRKGINIEKCRGGSSGLVRSGMILAVRAVA